MTGFKTLAAIALFATAMSACASSTIPRAAKPTDPIRHTQLEVPIWLDVISVDFAAAMQASDQGTSRGRGFFTVFGRHKESGTHYLLLYEGISRRTAPIEIVEVLRAAADSTGA